MLGSSVVVAHGYANNETLTRTSAPQTVTSFGGSHACCFKEIEDRRPVRDHREFL